MEKKKNKPSNPKPSLQNPTKKRKIPLSESENQKSSKKKKKSKKNPRLDGNDETHNDEARLAEELPRPVSASEQLRFFLDHYQSANGVQLSSLELESFSDTQILKLSECSEQVTETVGEDVKFAFGPSWKEVLCEKRISKGKVDVGNPAILIISASALRSIELLKGFRSFTKECHAAKLFSKHMKVEEQISLLKNRVNIASGTPSRIKKLIDIEALGLSRLVVLLLDIRQDVKGYSLLTLPQVRDEFWDLYKNYFHQRLVDGTIRLALYGPLPKEKAFKGKKKPLIA